MQATDLFKSTIESYLRVRANTDELFAKSFAKEGKTIDSCVNYIINQVKKSGCCGFADEEIYSMAVHYYDEDDIDPEDTKPLNARVVVNHHVDPAKTTPRPEPKKAEPKPKREEPKKAKLIQLDLFA